MKNFLKIVLSTAIVLSCTTNKNNTTDKNQALVSGTEWILSDNVKGIVPTLKIEEGKISGNAGCNSYFGTVSTDATSGQFTVSNVGLTRKMCVNMEAEQNFVSALNETNHYVVTENNLELYKGKLLLLKFSKKQ